MLRTHEGELESWDYLIQLLKEKVGCLQQQLERNPATSSSEDLTSEAQDNDHVMVHPVFDVPHDTQHRPTTIKLSETLTKFSGEDNEDEGAFPRWLRKLERVAGLYKWSDEEKLVQFELLLIGRAEKLHEFLSAVDHESFKSATEALQKRLTPAGREAQLMRRRQQTNESVNEFTQDFKRLFEQSYCWRQEMDESSCAILKRDLFIQGLLLKWQEKALPSADTFADALYQARSMDEQSKQLSKMHASGGGQRESPHSTKKPQEEISTRQSQHQYPKETNKKCHHCGSTKHFIRDCPMKRAQTETPGRKEQHTSNTNTGQIQQS